jgi:hypothetical protein
LSFKKLLEIPTASFIIILAMSLFLSASTALGQNVSQVTIFTRVGTIDYDTAEKLLPQNGIMYLKTKGKLHDYCFSHPEVEAVIQNRLQKLVPEGIVLLPYEKKKTGDEYIGKITISGKRQKFKQMVVTDIKINYPTMQKTGYMYYDEQYILSINASHQSVNYRKFRLSRETNWSYLNFAHSDRITESAYDYKMTDDEKMSGLIASPVWDEIPNFKYLDIVPLNYAFTGLSISIINNKQIYLNADSGAANEQPFGIRLEVDDIAKRMRFKYLTSGSYNLLFMHNLTIIGIELSSLKFFLCKLGPVKFMPYGGLALEIEALAAALKGDTKVKLAADPKLNLGTNLVIPIKGNVNLFTGVRAVQPLIRHQGSFDFGDDRLYYRFENTLSVQVEVGACFYGMPGTKKQPRTS